MTTKTSEDKDEFVFNLKGKRKGGRLEGWRPDDIVNNEYVMGKVHNSPQEKFEDGDIVKCSRTIKIHEKDGTPYILETKHSYYYLGMKGGKEALNEYYQSIYKDRDNWR